MTRRRVLKGMGVALATLPLARLVMACGEGTEPSNGADSGTGATAWATGGTAAMTLAASYPDPFASGIGTACALTCEATLGPCYASDFCTSGDAEARAARWFRGVQTTDANGRVNFDTCFPGWYSSRTIHIFPPGWVTARARVTGLRPR
ncbi:hypothetical protein [Myxococcus sp. Y35]|uniref:hypothetical protein n=1 Tax=Pseudomyxococcus flavus TaxID=3115648 RepID=UPI003CEB6C97